ncbi:MAG TPA: hypothetical protein VG965_01780 [Patescibacteria group bacterium]|nr:hypothetical protein [Patescibacteria group bacterium]
MDNFNQFKKDFKRDLLIKIVISLKHGYESKTDSQALVRKLLEILKIDDQRMVFSQLNKFSEGRPDILDIIIKRFNEFDEREKTEKINQIIIYFKSDEGGEIN